MKLDIIVVDIRKDSPNSPCHFHTFGLCQWSSVVLMHKQIVLVHAVRIQDNNSFKYRLKWKTKKH